jgi:hypothetical protein
VCPDILRVRLRNSGPGTILLESLVLRVTRLLPLDREAEADAAGDLVRLDDDVTEDGVVERGGCCCTFGTSGDLPHTDGRPRLPNTGFEAWKETMHTHPHYDHLMLYIY